jgi:hypothetical protein
MTADRYYTSRGITLGFDTYNGIYPTEINIIWYRDNSQLASMDFQPDKAVYFFENKVEYYNRVVVTINAINAPLSRLKVRSVEFGYSVDFKGDELKNVSVSQSLDPVSTEILINTFDFVLYTDAEYTFQTRQPLVFSFNNELRGTAFVKTAKRVSKNQWNIHAEDYIGIMDSVTFGGGIYTNQNAVELLQSVFDTANVPYTIADELNTKTVSGYIPYGTCRQALMQIAFAIGAVVDTSNSKDVDIYVLTDEVTQTIPLNRIMQGQSFEDNTRVTSVEVTAHTYKPITEGMELYDSAESGTGEGILVTFSEPIHDLAIVNGTIVSRETNYAIINAGEDCILSGQKYDHTTITKRKKNPLVLTTDIENTISITDATLVSPANIDEVLEKCYNHFEKAQSINTRIVEGRHETEDGTTAFDKTTSVGEKIAVETEYSGTLTGTIVSQKYSLNGGIVIKDTVIK